MKPINKSRTVFKVKVVKDELQVSLNAVVRVSPRKTKLSPIMVITTSYSSDKHLKKGELINLYKYRLLKHYIHAIENADVVYEA